MNRVERKKKSQVPTRPDQSETVDYTGRTDNLVRFGSGLEISFRRWPVFASIGTAAVCIHSLRNRYQ